MLRVEAYALGVSFMIQLRFEYDLEATIHFSNMYYQVSKLVENSSREVIFLLHVMDLIEFELTRCR